MRDFEIAKMIVNTAFNDKVDLSGRPYYEHLERVASKFPDNTDIKVIALLHDLLEDCPEWSEKVLKCFFYDTIVNSILVLTKKKGEDYQDYIKRVSLDNYATRVKIADLKDNMDITRLDSISEKDAERLRKYLKAYKFLTG